MAASRFRVVSRNTKKIGETEFTVVQDVKTGVLYTYGEGGSVLGGFSTHVTLLVDANGKPVVKPLNYVED